MTVGRVVDQSQRTFVSYIDKSREFYLAQGFDNPYRWAYFEDVPFTPLAKPLSECVVALITTASLPSDGPIDTRPPAVVYSVPSDDPPERLYTMNRFWDKLATHTEDLDSFFPIHRLQELARQGRIRLAARAHGVPTEYSQRNTIIEDAPEVLRRCLKDGVDAAVLVPL